MCTAKSSCFRRRCLMKRVTHQIRHLLAYLCDKIVMTKTQHNAGVRTILIGHFKQTECFNFRNVSMDVIDRVDNHYRERSKSTRPETIFGLYIYIPYTYVQTFSE